MKTENKKKKKKIEGNCYFCNQELKQFDKTEKIRLGCCHIVAHKKELYKWFLKNQHCPNCLSVHKQERNRLLNWGMNLENPDRKHQKTRTLVKNSKPIRFEKKLRE